VSSCLVSCSICDHTSVDDEWPGLGTGDHVTVVSGSGNDPVSGVGGGLLACATCDSVSVKSGLGCCAYSWFSGTYSWSDSGLSGVGMGLSFDGICNIISDKSGLGGGV
jgi:hypothetical protein